MKLTGFRLPNGAITVKIPRYEGIFTVNGAKVPNENIVISDTDVIEKVQEIHPVMHYTNAEDEIISIEEYTKREQELLAKATGTDDDGEPEFEVDDQIAWIVLRRKFWAVRKDSTVNEPVEIEIIPLPDESEKYPEYIETTWRTSDKLNNTCIADVRRFILGMFPLMASKYTFDPKKVTGFDPAYPNLEFLKIEGVYFNNFKQYEKNKVYRGTMEECETFLDEVIADIGNLLAGYVKRKTTPVSFNEIVADLEVVLGVARKIEPMKKSYHTHNDLCSRLSRLIESYKLMNDRKQESEV